MAETFTLSIIIPAFNEAERIPETLALVKDFAERVGYVKEVIVVDDGSTDDTVSVVQDMMPRFPQLSVLVNERNKGKGGVVRQGMLAATGDFRLFMDADNSTSVNEVLKLMPHTAKYDVVIGSRYLDESSIKVKQPWKRRVVSRTGNWLIQRKLLRGIKDTQCGFKLFSAKAAQDIFPYQTMTGWSFDVEVLTIAQQRGFLIKEVPIDWYDAKQSKLRAAHAAWKSLRELRVIRRMVKSGAYQRERKEGG
jgi:dolichyl-phosphate beta-glucosyltransferase